MKKKRVLIIAALVISLVAFCGCGDSSVKAEQPKEPEKQNVEVNSAKPEDSTPKKEEQSNGIRQELKDFLESYEAVMDEYVEFMKNYKAGDPSMLAKYTEILQKYTDFAQKAEAWKDKNLNNEELLYYTEVVTRVSEKLLNVSLSK